MNKEELIFQQNGELSTLTGFALVHHHRKKLLQVNFNRKYFLIETPYYCRISVHIMTKNKYLSLMVQVYSGGSHIVKT